MSILVVLEPNNDGLKRTSYEAIGAAISVGNGPVHGVAFSASNEQIATAGRYGLASCLAITGADWQTAPSSMIAAAIADAAKSLGATTVLFAANAFGKSIAPRVAIRLEAGLLADCVELTATDSGIQAARPVYSGKARVHVRAATTVTVATLRPNVFTAKASSDATVEIQGFIPTSHIGVRSAQVNGLSKNEGMMDVSEADIIVSGGRGLKGPEHFNLIEDLATSLGAAVGASRAVVDAGWRPHREQVGQTGKTVSPTMYVACGISGAVQHLAGMSSSKIIVAVNKDKDAPIFTVADYGIVGDVFEVLPKLTSAISTVTGKN